ncbi:NUDIX domain-containing protein [Rhodoplanes sp. Z2-YC6860]|uniref:NUDIX domain-containing protein n=1 Tax=Rhodoplanes sp. Z2-YC6860 TaxID=674703 RepID=UPI0018DB82C4|nr:NUDIX domain-containing protein [Rhodoplanes sp. Z2-YC6860]
MSDEWPKIKARTVTTISPWMDVIAREVEFAPDAKAEVYHAVGQRDYLAILARTPDGRIPLVRQYRPAMEAFTWELPAGLLEEGEDAAEAAARELLEETGYPARATHSLGAPASPCTGRLSNRVHSFFVETGEQLSDFKPEPGLTVALKTPAELVAMIKADEFVQQLHLGTLMMAGLKGFLKLPV